MRDAGWHDVGAKFRRAGLGKRVSHFRKSGYRLLDLQLLGLRLRQAGARNTEGVQRHVSLVELRDEHLAEPKEQRKTAGEENAGERRYPERRPERPLQPRSNRPEPNSEEEG